MVKAYSRRPLTVQALKLERGSYSEAMVFIEENGYRVDVNVKAFIGIISPMGGVIPAHYGDYIVFDDKHKNFYVFDPPAFKANFVEKKDDTNQ